MAAEHDFDTTSPYRISLDKDIDLGKKKHFSKLDFFLIQELSYATNSDFLIPLSEYCRTFISQIMNSVRSDNPSLKYQRFIPSGCNYIGIENLSLWQRLNFFLSFLFQIFQSI